MKFLPILILIFLLAPVFVLAATPITRCYDTEQQCCVEYDADIPCSGRPSEDNLGYPACYPYYCAQGACKELWDSRQYCTLKICCALTKIQRFMFFIAAGLAIIVIVWAGIMYMVAGGEEKATKAKKTLLYGLIGAAIVFSSGFIINLLMEILY